MTTDLVVPDGRNIVKDVLVREAGQERNYQQRGQQMMTSSVKRNGGRQTYGSNLRCYKTGADKRIYLPAASKMTINKVRSAITVLSTFRAKHEPVSGSQGSEYELEPSPMCLAPQNCQINQ